MDAASEDLAGLQAEILHARNDVAEAKATLREVSNLSGATADHMMVFGQILLEREKRLNLLLEREGSLTYGVTGELTANVVYYFARSHCVKFTAAMPDSLPESAG